jgi:hypothetical protein
VKNRLVSALCEADLDEWCRSHAKGGSRIRVGGRRREGQPERFREGLPWSDT